MGILDNIKNAFGSRSREAVEKPAADAPSAAAQPEPAEAATYVVQSGDTLWRIAREHYGDGDQYLQIFEANRGVLDSPDQIEPGQSLTLPPLPPE